MMYTQLPKVARRVVKTTLAGAWLLSACAGISAVVLSPTTIVREIGFWLTVISGSLLIIGAVGAALGVAISKYRLEWVFSWVSAAAIAPYLLTVWAFTLGGENTRSTQAFLVSSLFAFYLSRAALCSAHAAKLRMNFEASTGALDIMERGESFGDDLDPNSR